MYQILRVLGLLVLTSFCFLLNPIPVQAVSLSVSDYPSVVDSNIFSVTVNVNGANDGVNYLRIDLYKEGTTNYFGETYNGSDWYSGSDGLKYFPINIINSTASAALQGQVGNPSSTKYIGPGEYKLKIRRYTTSGSQSSNDTQNSISLQINYSTPSPEPTNTPTIQPTIVPTSIPTNKETSKPLPTKSATLKPETTNKSTSIPEDLKTELPFYDTTKVDTETASPIPDVKGVSIKGNNDIIAIILITLGLLFLGYGGYLLYNNIHANKK